MYRNPGRRATRKNCAGKVWWPSIYVDKDKKTHHLMYIKNPVKFVWTRWPERLPGVIDQDGLVLSMTEGQERLRQEGYLGG